MTEKKALRQAMLKMRRQLSSQRRQSAAQAIAADLQAQSEIIEAQHIGVYAATKEELSLEYFIEWAEQQGKTLYWPLISPEGSTLRFASAQAPIVPNRYGILEPDVDWQQSLAVTTLEVVIIPCVAASLTGQRLGMGKGYYDRTLVPGPYRIIVAFREQCAQWSADPWDQTVDKVLLA